MTRRRENREAIRWAGAAVAGAAVALWIFVIEPMVKAWGWV